LKDPWKGELVNISNFDHQMKDSILLYKSKTISSLMTDFMGVCKSTDSNKIACSLFDLYSKNSFFQSLFTNTSIGSYLQSNSPQDSEIHSNHNFFQNACSMILILAPKYSKKSAGITVLHYLYNYLKSSGFGVDLFEYTNSFQFHEKINIFPSQYQIMIIAETVSHIPFIPKHLLIYNLNPTQDLPKVALGEISVNNLDAININYFKKDTPDSINLRINTVDFERFMPNLSSRLGGIAIYLGKAELNYNHKQFLFEISERFETRLIITRNWPKNSELPSYARELDLLVTLDPISSLNFEFAMAGCPVYFHPDFLTPALKDFILKDQTFNSNFRMDNSNLLNLGNELNLKMHSQYKRNTINTQIDNLLGFRKYIISLLS
jgi:hypothetical protein